MGSSSPRTQTTTQTNEAPSWAAPALQQAVSKGLEVAGNPGAFSPFPGSRVADPSWQTNHAMLTAQNLASGGHPLADVAYARAQDIIGKDGIAAGMQPSLATLDGFRQDGGITTSGQYQGAADRALSQNADVVQHMARIGHQSQGPSAADSYLTRMARGDEGIDPNLKTMLDDRMDQTFRTMRRNSGGRYGSGRYDEHIARGITAEQAPVLFQASEAAKGRQLQATGAIDASRQSLMGINLNALAGIAGTRGADFDRHLAGLAGRTGVEGQNAANRIAAAGGLLSAYDTGLSRAGAFSSLVPGLQDARFDPARRLAQVGSFHDALNQQRLTDEAQRWEMNRDATSGRAPADWLGGLASGTSRGYGSSTTVAPNHNPSALSRAFSGAGQGGLLGYQTAGPWGAAIGGGLGLLGGLF